VTCDDLIFCSRLRGFQGSACPRVAISFACEPVQFLSGRSFSPGFPGNEPLPP
jgi:hypothetical protein